jgi:hypothetical protein
MTAARNNRLDTFWPSMRSTLGVIGVDYPIVRVVGIALVLVVARTVSLNPVAAISALIAVAAADLGNLFSLRNYFLGYVWLVLGVGGSHFAPNDLTIPVDLLAYVSTFLAAYFLMLLWVRSKAPPTQTNTATPTRDHAPAEILLMLVIVGWFALLVGELTTYGISGFYSGQALADRIARYGQPDFITGLMSGIEQMLSITTVALSVNYIQSRASRGLLPNYWMLSLPLLVAPLLLLRRSDFAVGVLFLLAVQPMACRLVRLRYSLIGSIPLIVGSIVLAFAVSVLIGSIRENATAPPTPNVATAPHRPTTLIPPGGESGLEPALLTEERTVELVYGELSPVVGYRDIREHPDEFRYRFGETILPPLALKIIPRSWLPAKPISSSAYYMEIRAPKTLAAGYILPVTALGDALLNFGYAGALALVLIFGAVCSRLDLVLKAASRAGVAAYLVVFYNFHSLLRNDLANSLAVLALTALVLVLVSRLDMRFVRALNHGITFRKPGH